MTSTQKRSRDEAKAKYEEEMTKQAPKMLELAEKALEAVHEMIALEEQVNETIGKNCTAFSYDENRTLEDAAMAISVARHVAEQYVQRAKKAKTDA
jgi:hypothetical protein